MCVYAICYNVCVPCVMCVICICMCLLLVTVPSVPISVSILLSSVYTYGNAGLTVSWSAPNDNGGSVITNYTASCTGGGLSSPATYTGMSTSFAVTGLSGGMSVTCSVKATNTKGDSIQTTDSITPGKRIG